MMDKECLITFILKGYTHFGFETRRTWYSSSPVFVHEPPANPSSQLASILSKPADTHITHTCGTDLWNLQAKHMYAHGVHWKNPKFAQKKEAPAQKQAQVPSDRASLSFCWNYGYVILHYRSITIKQRGNGSLNVCVCFQESEDAI